MSDNYIDPEIDSDDTDEEPETNGPRGLRRAANKSKKLEEELAQARREMAFLKAGINTEDPRMRYFVKGYDGEYTAEAVRQAALEAGFLTQQSNDPGLADVAGAQDRVMSAAAGAVYEDASEQAALGRLQAAMEEGGIDAMLEVARQYGIPTQSEM